MTASDGLSADIAMTPVCVLAGGLGSRLGAITDRVPKALVEVADEPFLFHPLRELAHQGVTEVVLCVGHLGELIESTIGAERFGLRIAYSYDSPGLDGTLGAIRGARHLLGDEFLILYGDTLLTIDYVAAVAHWRSQGTSGFMSVLRNDGRWGESNAEYADGRVVAYDKWKPTAAMQWIDYGLTGLRASALDRCQSANDLAELWHELAAEGQLAGMEVRDRFYEIGTPESLEETRDHVWSRVSRGRSQ